MIVRFTLQLLALIKHCGEIYIFKESLLHAIYTPRQKDNPGVLSLIFQ